MRRFLVIAGVVVLALLVLAFVGLEALAGGAGKDRIATALSSFDTNFTTSILWGHSVAPFNNAISAGTFIAGARFPVIFNQDTAAFQTGVQKRTATGALLGVTHNINYLYSNSTLNVTPSAYTTNLQLSLTQPLLGSSPLVGGGIGRGDDGHRNL